jgi:drug/metabolite transporter (DMT)-like permease
MKPAELDRGALTAVLIATLSIGVANFFHALGVRHGSTPETVLASQAVVFVDLATIFVRATDGALAPPRAMWKHTAAAAVVLLGAFLLMLYGLTRGPASVLIPIAQKGFVITAALGIVLLREPVTVRKAAGLAAAVVALAVLGDRLTYLGFLPRLRRNSPSPGFGRGRVGRSAGVMRRS